MQVLSYPERFHGGEKERGGATLFLDPLGFGCTSRMEGPRWGIYMTTGDFTAKDWVERLALARSDRFQTEDKILDVAIALERMYDLEEGEISFKLNTRTASFLETSMESRRRLKS